MEIDPDLLRQYARDCERSADQLDGPAARVEPDSVIAPDAWQGGNLVWLFQLQSALDDMRDTYERVRGRMVDRLSAIEEDTRDTATTLREVADEAEEGDLISAEELDRLWP